MILIPSYLSYFFKFIPASFGDDNRKKQFLVPRLEVNIPINMHCTICVCMKFL